MLDVGAGSAGVALAAAAAGARVTALDLSPARIEEGRSRCAAAGADVQWVEGSVEAMPLEDGAFDAVLSGFGAMFARRPRAAAAELVRVTRPGGFVALTAWSSTGFMAGLLDLAARWSPSPAEVRRACRWGRYESAFLWLGSVVEEFEATDCSIALTFDDAESAWSCLSSAPGPLSALPELAHARESLDELLARFAVDVGASPVAVSAGYSIVSGRRPQA